MATVCIAQPNAPKALWGLVDVLAVLEPYTTDLQWYCLELDFGFPCDTELARNQPWVRDVCNEVEERRAGVPLPWRKIKSLAEKLRAEDMTLFAATLPGLPAPSWPLNIGSLRFEITIQNNDEHSWNVTTRNASVIARLREKSEKSRILA